MAEENKTTAEETAEKVKETEAAESEVTEATPETQAGSEEVEEAKEKKLFGKKKKDKKDEKIEELTDRVKRQMAEFENFRKRTEKEKAGMYAVGAKDVIEKILPVVDNFEKRSGCRRRQRRSFRTGNGKNLQAVPYRTGWYGSKNYRSRGK